MPPPTMRPRATVRRGSARAPPPPVPPRALLAAPPCRAAHGPLAALRAERRALAAAAAGRESGGVSDDATPTPANRGGAAGPLRAVASPSASSASSSPPPSLASLSTVSSAEILAPVAADMETMNANLRRIVGDRHPMLVAAADSIFAAGGKRLRPALVFLVARATAQLMGLSDINDHHRRLAEITEMIHTASLMHDDVLDDCPTRRGAATVHSTYGTRVAVLVGDFLFAQSSWLLARLDNLDVIKLISQVIADFANGEIAQAAALFDTDRASLPAYLDKSFYKTATLIAASCRGAAVFSGCSADVQDAMFEYGRRLGLAFQIVDDVLDFTAPEAVLGKPRGQDLAAGNLTAPAVYALASPRVGDELRALIEAEFPDDGDLDRALALVAESGGLDDARRLARAEADAARAALACLPECEAKASLEMMVEYVLDRLY